MHPATLIRGALLYLTGAFLIGALVAELLQIVVGLQFIGVIHIGALTGATGIYIYRSYISETVDDRRTEIASAGAGLIIFFTYFLILL